MQLCHDKLSHIRHADTLSDEPKITIRLQLILQKISPHEREYGGGSPLGASENGKHCLKKDVIYVDVGSLLVVV